MKSEHPIQRLIEALDLPPKTTSVSLNFKAENLAVMRVEAFVQRDALAEIETIVREYELKSEVTIGVHNQTNSAEV